MASERSSIRSSEPMKNEILKVEIRQNHLAKIQGLAALASSALLAIRVQ